MSAADEISPAVRIWGRVAHCDGTAVRLAGLGGLARIGDGVRIGSGDGREILGEVIALGPDSVTAMLMAAPQGLAAGQRAYLVPDRPPSPCDGWLGHVIDAFGRLTDGRPAPQGDHPAMLRRAPPRGERRRMLGPRLATGQSAMDTMLPLCRGQRMGVFAGSGVGKSMLMAGLARGVEADVVVVGLIGERGREVSEFARNMLGERAMARTVVIAATSDQTALVKRRAALLCLAVAEHFRDRGRHVLCLFDSVTRFAEAHREIALAAGEAPALRAFPPSTPQVISALCERAGPGEEGSRAGDITGIFTVLVSGSDMDEPVADMVRGTLDGHLVLDRAIAERGRFPAIDLRRSVSRSAPMAWSEREAALVARARALIARYEEAEPMIQAGLYTLGTTPEIDEAIALWPALDRFVGTSAEGQSDLESFARLSAILDSGGTAPEPAGEG
ncbi:MAG: FliI/YscN family ATPase [Proteobacteria bacterium]|nr:FliI/YscN family ATPase [Pseudomonadota bacterium]